MFYEMRQHNEQHSIESFRSLEHEVTGLTNPTNAEIKKILEKPFLKDMSYQLIFMKPSGQTYIHRHTRPNERELPVSPFPTSSPHYLLIIIVIVPIR